MNYERLDVWRKSVALTTEIYSLMKDNRDFGFKDQICRSSVSVPSNIAEGCERLSRKEKAHFLAIAKGSLGELKTQVIIADNIGYIAPEPAMKLKHECDTIGRMLGALIKRTQGT